MLSDTVADTLTRIRNALAQKHRYVDVTRSKLHMSMLLVMKEHGFIQALAENEEKRLIRVYLKYDKSQNPVISGLKRISKPGRRLYVKSCDVPVIRRGLGLAIVSTSKGVKSGHYARKEKLGGELLCSVW